MKERFAYKLQFFCFSLILGVLAGSLVWLYLKISNVGITLIWSIIPQYIDTPYYTVILCLAGGLVIGIFHQIFGKYPQTMADAVKTLKETETFYYDKMPMLLCASLLPVFFGGAVGPECGLVSIIIALAVWIYDQLRAAELKLTGYFLESSDTGKKKGVFLVLASGIMESPSFGGRDLSKVEMSNKKLIVNAVGAGLTAFVLYLGLNALFGAGVSIPHLEGGEIAAWEKAASILLIAAGIGAGYLYLIAKKFIHMFFAALEKRKLAVLNAVLGGLVLGLVGTVLPMTMFSGGNDIQAIEYEYLQYTPVLLIVIGTVKLVLTSVCIESGWRGGHLFPIIFSGISIGCGLSVLLDINEVLAVILVTGALLGTVLQQPIGALFLSVLFFPVEDIGWMAIASAAGGCIPLPVSLREDPSNKGFIYNTVTRRKEKILEGKGKGD